MNLNKAQLYGNLTRDPELRALPGGGSVVNFSIATNRVYKDKAGAKQEQTEFHNVVAFGKQADVIGQYFKKGKAIYVEGRIQTRSWDKDGAKQYRTEVVVEQFQFGDGGRDERTAKDVANDGEARTSGDTIQYPDEDINPEDIPF